MFSAWCGKDRKRASAAGDKAITLRFDPLPMISRVPAALLKCDHFAARNRPAAQPVRRAPMMNAPKRGPAAATTAAIPSSVGKTIGSRRSRRRRRCCNVASPLTHPMPAANSITDEIGEVVPDGGGCSAGCSTGLHQRRNGLGVRTVSIVSGIR